MAKSIRNATVALTAATSGIISEQRVVGGRRLVLSVNNLNASGGDDVFISVDDEAAANKGVRIQPGQSFTWSMDGAYMPPQGRFNAYAAGNTNVSVYEEVE